MKINAVVIASFVLMHSAISAMDISVLIGTRLRLLQELKERFAPKLVVPMVTGATLDDLIKEWPAGKPLPTTLAHYKKNRNSIQQQWQSELAQHSPLIERIVRNEMAHTDKYVVVYHAQRATFRLLHDLLREIYQVLNLQGTMWDHHFIRAWHEALPTVDANHYLDDLDHNGWPSWDTIEPLCSQLLSVNLALFGNIGNSGEHTFNFFITDTNISYFDVRSAITALFNAFHFNTDYIDQVQKVFDANKSNQGTLYQILIPNELVDRCVYLCKPGGFPYSDELVSACYDRQRGRHSAFLPIIDWYRSDARTGNQLDPLQARIIFSQDLVLNPNSGIKVVRYTTNTPAQEQTYHAQLKEIVHTMLAQWLQTGGFRRTLPTGWYPLQRWLTIINQTQRLF